MKINEFKAYTDHGAYFGMKQYYDEEGQEWRVRIGPPHYMYYKRVSNGRFEHIACITLDKRIIKCKSLHEELLKYLDIKNA